MTNFAKAKQQQIMDAKQLTELADQLKARLNHKNFECIGAMVWADPKEMEIHIAPSQEAIVRRIHNVEEIVLFAQYNGLDVVTQEYETGAGIKLYD